MFPMVQTVEEARAAVSATRYPPHGIRGVAAVHRASRFGAVPDYLRSSGPELEVIVQVETPQAWERMADIASVDGVDAVFIGPSDLSANMGHLGNLAHPDVQDRVMRAPAIIHAQGRKAGVLVPTMDLARQCAAQGYDFVAIGSDLSAMLAGVRGHVQAWGAKDSALPMASAIAPTGSAY
jgi:2-dehydro-3-deoxyglucarate aldolase/4-hydroxy-2-oxoheptanedioate aldolase